MTAAGGSIRRIGGDGSSSYDATIYPDRRPAEIIALENQRRRDIEARTRKEQQEYEERKMREEERRRPRQRMPIDQDFDNYPQPQQPSRGYSGPPPPPPPDRDVDPYPQRRGGQRVAQPYYDEPPQQRYPQRQPPPPPQERQPPPNPQPQQQPQAPLGGSSGEIVDAAVRLAETKGIPENFYVFGIITVGSYTLKTEPMRANAMGGDTQRVVFQDVRDNDPGSIQIACLDRSGGELVLGSGEFDLRPGEHVCFLKALNDAIPQNCRAVVRVGTRKQF